MGTKCSTSVAAIALIALLAAPGVFAADRFAAPEFAQRWQQDEQRVLNFWGPLATARDGQTEPYAEATGGTRLVQYFDKGRMELTASGRVTSGLLATELLTGRVQLGDARFDQRPPAAIPVAGDTTNTFPLYRDVAVATFAKPSVGALTQTVLAVESGGPLGQAIGGPSGGPPTDPAAIIAAIEPQTGHGVAQAFATFRASVGVDVVGLAVTEPFWTPIMVGGQLRPILVQVFERRALTYNAANPDPFKVEFGNIGRQYYAWRYNVSA